MTRPIAATMAGEARGPKRGAPESEAIEPAYFYPVDAYTTPDADTDDAEQGIPVFTPTMAQFADFYTFCQAIDRWGMQSGIVKVIPPKEWTDALPSLRAGEPSTSAARIDRVSIKNAITQHFLSAGPGRWKQTNVTRAKAWDTKQWADLAHEPAQRGPPMARIRAKVQAAVAAEEAAQRSRLYTAVPPAPVTDTHGVRTRTGNQAGAGGAPPKATSKAPPTTDAAWAAFDYQHAWTREAQGTDAAPPAPAAWDPQACRAIESEYWRSLNFGKPPMYGADLQGTLFDEHTTAWNVGKLDSLLTRLGHALPGVTTPYLYFGMWRASFAWHVEDMDLYSINYIHFGAPKQWYAIRQADRLRFESVMKAAFPQDSRKCAHFLRHKSFLVSPTFLASQGVRPQRMVQHAGEFVITYPHGYHSGYNLGFNCAESVNFALPSWVEIGRAADYCKCDLAQESVHFDLDEFLPRAPAEHTPPQRVPPPAVPAKRAKPHTPDDAALACLFCVSRADASMVPVPRTALPSLLRTPAARKSAEAVVSLQAHRLCASFIPETWVSDHDTVQGAEHIERARWALKCAVCKHPRDAKHGAKIQCTKGRCPRAVHVGCALDDRSGWFLDFLEKDAADRFEGCAGSAGERLVVLCRAHNPLRKEQETARREDERLAVLRALAPGADVRIKTGSGTWTTRLHSLDEVQQTVWVYAVPEEPSNPHCIPVPWARVVLDAAVAQAPREDAFVLECKVPVRRDAAQDTVEAPSDAPSKAPGARPADEREHQAETPLAPRLHTCFAVPATGIKMLHSA